MSWLRLLTRSRQQLWQSARRRKSSATVEAAKGPEPPNGFLFNEKPLLPGETRQKEPWENLWLYGMTFNFLLMIGVVALKPDTSVSGWARQQAMERLSSDSETTGQSEESDS